MPACTSSWIVRQEELPDSAWDLGTRELEVPLVHWPAGFYTEGLFASRMEQTVNSTTVVRREIYYSGNVQGVGFRYTTCHLASRYDVTGFVRNLPDRRVQVVVEGALSEIRALLGDIASTMAGYIRKTEISDLDATGEFDRFGIRY
jgi:acylphosphatase